jgi:hypothetical protein
MHLIKLKCLLLDVCVVVFVYLESGDLLRLCFPLLGLDIDLRLCAKLAACSNGETIIKRLKQTTFAGNY